MSPNRIRFFSHLAVLLCLLFPTAASGATAHRIQIRTRDGVQEFYDRTTGNRFVPRGYNYVRLARLRKLTDKSTMLYHSTFLQGYYDRKAATAALEGMAAGKYNVVRVFLNAATEGAIQGVDGTFSDAYLKNLADFLAIARKNKLYVIITIDWIPIRGPISDQRSFWCEDFQCTASQVLTETGIRANENFFSTFVQKLLNLRAPVDYVLAYEVRNELTFDSNLPPLSLPSGKLRTANGKVYDLSSTSQKQQMLEDGIVFWLDRIRAKIRTVDPTALVSIGLVPPSGPNPTRVGDPRISVTRSAVQQSQADFIDIHVYPMADSLTYTHYRENFGITNETSKPVILGEFGALTSIYPSIEAAARSLVEWQVASSRQGASGWILWAWDINSDPDCYYGVDSSRMIDRMLSPAFRPDPGAGIPLASIPAAQRVSTMTVRASATYEQNRPENVIDGTARPWISGGPAPQWVEISLPQPTAVRLIRLIVSQDPRGPTQHQVWIREEGSDFKLDHEFTGDTKDRDVLQYRPVGRNKVTAIRITTVQSPSWVAWREIEIR